MTTLASHAYEGERNLYEAVLATAGAMPHLLENRNGVWWVANPIQPEENFADKWVAHPERQHQFLDWTHALQADLDEARQERGLDQVAARLAKSFGEGPVTRAAERLGASYRTAREAGALSFAAPSGALGAVGTTRVRDHRFYGAPPTAPRS